MRSEVTRRTLLTAVGTAAGVSVLPQRGFGRETATDEWPAFGYDTGKTGYNPDGTGPRTAVGGAWQFTATETAIDTGSAIADGVVYTTSRGGNVYAVDGETGEGIDGWPVELGDESVCPPTVRDGTVYVGDDGGTLYAIDIETAEIEWRFGTGGAVRGSPTVLDGTAYVTSGDGAVFAVETTRGEHAEWEFDTGAGIHGGVAVEQTAQGAAETVYVGTRGGTVFALDAATGTRRWDEPLQVGGEIRSAPAWRNGSLYVGTTDGIEGAVSAIDTDTGAEQWQFAVGGTVFGSPVVTDEAVYFASRDRHIYAVDSESGDERWRFETDRQFNNSPVVVGETVYAASFDNTVYGLTLDGDQRFAVDTGGTISASPAVADGRIYLGSDDATLYALESDGEFEFGSEETDTDAQNPNDDGSGDSPLADSDTDGLTFLLLPASVVTVFGLFVGGLYAVLRSDWASQFAVDEAPIESLYDGESIPDYDDRTETEVWSLVVGDVIERANEQTKTAQENVIVTKYIDTALDSPIAAYTVESAREQRVQVRLTEPLGDRPEALEDQPLNEGWTLGDEQLTFEATVEPGETIRTMVGRTDFPDGHIETVLDKPTLTVETDPTQTANDA